MVVERFQQVISQLFQQRIVRMGGAVDDDMANCEALFVWCTCEWSDCLILSSHLVAALSDIANHTTLGTHAMSGHRKGPPPSGL